MTGAVRPRASRASATSVCREALAVVAPLLAVIIALGFFPKPLLDVINPAVDRTHAAGRRHRPQAADAG